MIRVLLSELADVKAEAILRSVSSDLDPDTTFKAGSWKSGPGRM